MTHIAIIGTEGSGKTILATVWARRLAHSTESKLFLSYQNIDTERYVERAWESLNKGEWLPSTPQGSRTELEWQLQLGTFKCPIKLIDLPGQDLRKFFDGGASTLTSDRKALFDYVSSASVVFAVVNLERIMKETQSDDRILLSQIVRFLSTNAEAQHLYFVFTAWDRVAAKILDEHGSLTEYIKKELTPFFRTCEKAWKQEGKGIYFLAVAPVAQTVYDIQSADFIPKKDFESYNLDNFTKVLIQSIAALQRKTAKPSWNAEIVHPVNEELLIEWRNRGEKPWKSIPVMVAGIVLFLGLCMGIASMFRSGDTKETTPNGQTLLSEQETHFEITSQSQRQQGRMNGNIVRPVVSPVNIFEAAERGTIQDVQRFIATGINVTTTDDRGWTPLHYAAESNSNVELLKYLLEQGADVNARTNMGFTPMERANTDEKKRVLSETMARGTMGGVGGFGAGNRDRNTETQQQRQADTEARKEFITKAIPIDTVLNACGFSGGNAMSDLANFGSSTLKTNFNQAYGTWNRASSYDKDSTKAAFERVRTNIKTFTQREIAPRSYFGNWPYRISNLVVNGSESSFTMTIDVGFQGEKFRNLAVEDTFLAFPTGVIATASEFGSSQIKILVRGNTNVMREIDENKNNYNARVHFTNFRSSEVPTFRYFYNPASAEVLGIIIVRK